MSRIRSLMAWSLKAEGMMEWTVEGNHCRACGWAVDAKHVEALHPAVPPVVKYRMR